MDKTGTAFAPSGFDACHLAQVFEEGGSSLFHEHQPYERMWTSKDSLSSQQHGPVDAVAGFLTMDNQQVFSRNGFYDLDISRERKLQGWCQLALTEVSLSILSDGRLPPSPLTPAAGFCRHASKENSAQA
jgi:hypothetical protein